MDEKPEGNLKVTPEEMLSDEQRQSEKRPWEMNREEFLEHAKHGQMRSDETLDVREVVEGTKPIAIIAFPSNSETRAMRFLKKVEAKGLASHLLFTWPNSAATIAFVGRPSQDIQGFLDTYVGFTYDKDESGQYQLKWKYKGHPRERATDAYKTGCFLGYSLNDICFYLNHNMGYDTVVEDGLDERREALWKNGEF